MTATQTATDRGARRKPVPAPVVSAELDAIDTIGDPAASSSHGPADIPAALQPVAAQPTKAAPPASVKGKGGRPRGSGPKQKEAAAREAEARAGMDGFQDTVLGLIRAKSVNTRQLAIRVACADEGLDEPLPRAMERLEAVVDRLLQPARRLRKPISEEKIASLIINSFVMLPDFEARLVALLQEAEAGGVFDDE